MHEELSTEIFLKAGLFEETSSIISKISDLDKIIIIADKNTAHYYLEKLYLSLLGNCPHIYKIIISPGESSKNLKNFSDIAEEILSKQISRKTIIIALGGGVISDLSGFIASVLLRGLRYINIPTSLLSMVDSTIGGKTGINSLYGKNLIGSFHSAKYTIIDPLLLKTLPFREYISGYSEIVKHAMLAGEDEFKLLEDNADKFLKQDEKYLEYIISHSIAIKEKIVKEDPYETKYIRQLLNLGHSFAHAIEAYSIYENSKNEIYINHGEAVALGLKYALLFAFKYGVLEDPLLLTRVENLLLKMGLNLNILDFDAEILSKYFLFDKKNILSDITLILPKKLGKIILYKTSLEEIYSFLKTLR